MTSPSAMAAPLRKVWLSGWRDGKFIRPGPIGGIVFGSVLMTAACRSSASSTSRSMPAWRAGGAVGDEHRVGRADQQPRDFRDGARIGLRRRGERQLRDAQRVRSPGSGVPAARESATITTGPAAASAKSCTRAPPIRRSAAARPANRPTSRSRGPSPRHPARCAPIRRPGTA